MKKIAVLLSSIAFMAVISLAPANAQEPQKKAEKTKTEKCSTEKSKKCPSTCEKKAEEKKNCEEKKEKK